MSRKVLRPPGGDPRGTGGVGGATRPPSLVPLVVSGVVLIGMIFAAWGVVERAWLAEADPATLGVFYLTRGMTSSFLLMVWAALFAVRARRQYEHNLEGAVAERTRELQEEKGFHERTIAAVPAGLLVVDAELRVIAANRSFLESCGAGAEVVGRPVAHALGVPGIEPLLEETLAAGISRSGLVFTARFCGGAPRPVRLAISGIRPSSENLLVVAEDLSEEERLAARARVAERRFREVVERATDGIVMMDEGGRISYFNRAAEAMFGWGREEVLGRPMTLLMPEGYRAAHAEGLARFLATGESAFLGSIRQVEGLRRDGSVFPLEGAASVLLDDGVLFTAILRDITERKRVESRIKDMAYRDALTGLPNRRLFADRLGLALAQMQRLDRGLAVVFLDLDRFKVINDSLGHAVGDRVLLAVAERLQSSVREGDTVARMGGDEFTLLLPGLSGAVSAARVAEKVLAAVRQPLSLEGRELFVTCSLGIALFPGDGAGPETLLKNADTAMYRAKERGRDTYQLHTSAMNVTALEHLVFENSLRKALAQDELRVYYQPILDLGTGGVHSVEALLRWRHPELGLVGPSEFISLAEDIGAIFAMGPWVLRTACAQCKAWQDEGYGRLSVSVNLSIRQFQQPDLASQVARALEQTGLPPGCLELEISESCAMKSAMTTLQTLHALKALGVRVSIDDFGTGFSSLSHLRRFHLDTVKIDQSFVRDIGTDPDGMIVTAVIAMAHTLRLAVVAKGVETQEQLAFLASQRCERIQGYLFSPAVPAEACQELLARHGRA